MRGLAITGLVFAVLIAAVMALIFLPLSEHSRRQSPDGAFVAIARTQPFHAMVPVMPGQGSDKPGQVTIYRGNQSCGSAWLHAVSQFDDLRWDLDRKPPRAVINLGATWNLDNCSLEHVFSG